MSAMIREIVDILFYGLFQMSLKNFQCLAMIELFKKNEHDSPLQVSHSVEL